MKLTSEMIKDYAKKIGLDDVGIASIDRFKNAPALFDSKIFSPRQNRLL